MWQTLADIGEFIIVGVVFKYIILKWFADLLVKYAKQWFHANERNFAIWEHYRMNAFGKGHDNENILECGQGRCTTFSV